jgi:hypothetical protein
MACTVDPTSGPFSWNKKRECGRWFRGPLRASDRYVQTSLTRLRLHKTNDFSLSVAAVGKSRRAKPWWHRRQRTAFSRALGGGFGAPSSRRRCGSVGDGLARRLGPASRWVLVRWRGCWPRATWWRGWSAAPVGPDLGRGRQAGLRAATKLPGGGEVRWQTGGGGVKAGLLQRGDGAFVGLFGPGHPVAAFGQLPRWRWR